MNSKQKFFYVLEMKLFSVINERFTVAAIEILEQKNYDVLCKLANTKGVLLDKEVTEFRAANLELKDLPVIISKFLNIDCEDEMKLLSIIEKITTENFPLRNGSKKHKQFVLKVQELVWERNFQDGYNIDVYENNKHIGSIDIDGQKIKIKQN